MFATADPERFGPPVPLRQRSRHPAWVQPEDESPEDDSNPP